MQKNNQWSWQFNNQQFPDLWESNTMGEYWLSVCLVFASDWLSQTQSGESESKSEKIECIVLRLWQWRVALVTRWGQHLQFKCHSHGSICEQQWSTSNKSTIIRHINFNWINDNYQLSKSKLEWTHLTDESGKIQSEYWLRAGLQFKSSILKCEWRWR